MHPQIKVDRQVKIPMRDGINLTADIYRPRGVDIPLPVLLMRLPYGRAIASTVTYAHPSWYARHGYIVVIQDVRGCGTAEGEFYPFRNEYEDGFDSVTWCVEALEGSSGKVGMYGFSYQGVTQFQAAVMQPKGLITICPAMATVDFFHGWFYFGGAIALEFSLTWALQLCQHQAYYRRLEPLATRLLAAQAADLWQTVPLEDIALFKSDPAIAKISRFWSDWLHHDQADHPYWQDLNPLSRLEGFDLPALHIAGWADIFIEATIASYTKCQTVTGQPQHLIVGPWQHLPWRSQVGDVDYGIAAVPQIDQYQIDWFDYWLKGIDNGIMGRSPVQLFVMGANHWHNQATWISAPAQKYLTYYLGVHHSLHQTLEADFFPNIYVYDPRIPTPSTSYGAYDQKTINLRADVLTYSSVPLATNLTICGIPQFILHGATTAPHTDWVIRLLDIAHGQHRLVTMGVLRVATKAGVQEYLIKLRPTCHQFLAGHQIGIAISSAAFPLIARHSNTAEPPNSRLVSELQEATQEVYPHSHIQLPLIG